MNWCARPAALLTAAVFTVSLGASLAPAGARAAAQEEAERYALANGCYVLRSQQANRFVTRTAGTWTATATSASAAASLRMKATELGRYLFYGAAGDHLARINALGDVGAAATASSDADWRVDITGDGAFRITLPQLGKTLVRRADGRLGLVSHAAAGAAGRFEFVAAAGCATYPEVDVNATGEPTRGESPDAPVKGLVDAHIHMMAFEFLGGRAHCGRPWHRYGAPHALVDCADHGPGGATAVLENIVSHGNPAHTHDTVGWPTFKDWPHHKSLTHEQTYYRWLERAWRGGLRVYVNLLVENAVLCEVYPLKRNSCNEMDAVRLQAQRIRELENYIDAQEGGPGKGWFRLVYSPAEARAVINDGKLAVVLGIENSKLFDCGIYMDQPECDKADIDRELAAVHALGVRDMELVNKFDNALAGVAGDSGSTGVLVNGGNAAETGKYWQMETCDHGDGHVHDRDQYAVPGMGRDELAGAVLQSFLPQGTLPLYGPAPHCNTRGLSDLGEHLIRRMAERGMIFDPDHLSVVARNQALEILEELDYPGVISSHSWSTPDAYPRILSLGGMVTPYAGSSTGFAQQWQALTAVKDPEYLFGIGYGADMNGLGSQGAPRLNADNPVEYPFTSFDGAVTLDRQTSGQRVFDINVDGVAHYGLYPDWVEDLRQIAGPQIVEDLGNGAEAYLQMWQRAEEWASVTTPAPPAVAGGVSEIGKVSSESGKAIERAPALLPSALR